jgi:predicted Zn-dependent protease
VSVAWAEAAPSIIRDAEIENTIRSYANPLFSAAGIPTEAVTIRVLNSSVLNAFVTNGNRMFLHTGLILETKTPGELTGVIAHETGHIAGGHLVRLNDQIEKASLASMGSLALGVLAGLAAGRSDAGMAAMSLGQHVAQRDFFSYTRTQESSADQYALKILDATHQSAQGMIDFFETLVDQELLSSANQDPYMRTHPVTTDRIAAIRAHVEQAHIPYGAPTAQQLRHERMVAKLFAFLEPQGRTLQRYPESDQRLVARYARAIAYFRRGELNQALPLIDGLIAESPNDPYFWELKGQMLFENGRLPDAADAYRKSIALTTREEPLIELSLGHVLVESGGDANGREAERYLRKVITAEPRSGFAWRLLGSVYGQRGDETQASYAMAEYAMLTGDPNQALFHINKALGDVQQSDPLWLRLQDLKATAERAAGKEDTSPDAGK